MSEMEIEDTPLKEDWLKEDECTSMSRIWGKFGQIWESCRETLQSTKIFLQKC